MSNKKQTPFSVANVPNRKKQSAFRYELGDGEKSHQKNPETYSIPSREERENLVPGMSAKLTFHIYDGNKECAERMWVTVEDKQPDHYIGTLNNIPVSTTKLRMGDKVIFKPENVINIEGTENSLSEETLTDRYLAIGLDLIHLSAVDQAEVCHYVADQVEQFANGLTGGHLGTVNIVSGFLQITVHCEDTDQALTDFLSMLEKGEIDIPEENDEAPVFQYAMIGEDDPVQVLFDMMDEVNGEDWICDDCLKAMKEEEDAQAEKNVKH
jgi:hypothetical protein